MLLFRKKAVREPPSPDDWPRGTVELSEREFDGFIERYPVVAVEFWASWCAPCKTMRPIIRDLAAAYGGQVAIGKVNIERHRKLAEGNGVMSIPHLVFFSYGRKVGESHGRLTRRKLEGRFKRLVDKHGHHGG